MMMKICAQGFAGCFAGRFWLHILQTAPIDSASGFLLPSLHTLLHTLACCALCSIAEWKTPHWQEEAKKDVSRLSKSTPPAIGQQRQLPARLRQYVMAPTMLGCHHSTDGRETRAIASSFHWSATQSLIDCPITVSCAPPSTNR